MINPIAIATDGYISESSTIKWFQELNIALNKNDLKVNIELADEQIVIEDSNLLIKMDIFDE